MYYIASPAGGDIRASLWKYSLLWYVILLIRMHVIQLIYTQKNIEYILIIFHPLVQVTEIEKCLFICSLPFVC